MIARPVGGMNDPVLGAASRFFFTILVPVLVPVSASVSTPVLSFAFTGLHIDAVSANGHIQWYAAKLG